MATDIWSFLDHPKPDFIRFRHYGWRDACTTFGYGQSYDWVCKETGLASPSLCRRPTGGGIVDHGNDWTYSLILPNGCMPAKETVQGVYLRVHQAMSVALSAFSVATNLLSCSEETCSERPRKIIPGRCFLEPVPRDLVLPNGSEKIAGAAIKKTRGGILLQGTVARDILPKKMDWVLFEEKFIEGLASSFLARPVSEPWPENLKEVRMPYVEQFASDCWLRERRSTFLRR